MKVGDLVAFLATGAYQDAGANTFNALPRPATVLVQGAQAEVVKRRETVAEIFARDVVPERLGGMPRWDPDRSEGDAATVTEDPRARPADADDPPDRRSS